jgi:tetratricopeptide (TPR) repeat protein
LAILPLLVAILAVNPDAHADVANAKAHYERGQALYQLGEYRRALDEFKEAHIEKADPALLYNIAQCYRQLGDTENALAFYRRYLSFGPEGPLRADVERRIQELELARTAARPTPTTAPRATEARRVPLRMEPEASAAAVAAKPEIPDRRPELPLPRWLPWAGAGTTIALACVAIGAGVSASNKFDELHGSCGNTSAGCTTTEIDSVRSRAHLANVFWVLTGVAALGTGATIYVNTREAGVAGLWRF